MFNRQVSLAKWKVSEFFFFFAILRSLIKIKKSDGPRTEPSGTPYFTVFQSELKPLIEENWVLLLREDLNK